MIVLLGIFGVMLMIYSFFADTSSEAMIVLVASIVCSLNALVLMELRQIKKMVRSQQDD